MFAKSEVGQVAKRVAITKITGASASKQSIYLFGQQTEMPAPAGPFKARIAPGGNSSLGDLLTDPAVQENVPSQSNVAHVVKAGSQSNVFDKEDAPRKSSIKPAAAPGGNSTMGSILCDSPREIVPSAPSGIAPKSNIFSADTDARPSSRVLAAPGGKSCMSSILNHEHGEQLAIKKKANPQMVSQVFDDEAPAFKPSTKRFAAPGGASSNLFADDAAAEKPASIPRSARANQSKNVLNLSPESGAKRSTATAQKNISSHVACLTPKVDKTISTRTSRANTQSKSPVNQQWPAPSRHAAHNKMMASNIFAVTEEEPAKRTSVRMKQNGGGATKNIFG